MLSSCPALRSFLDSALLAGQPPLCNRSSAVVNAIQCRADKLESRPDVQSTLRAMGCSAELQSEVGLRLDLFAGRVSSMGISLCPLAKLRRVLRRGGGRRSRVALVSQLLLPHFPSFSALAVRRSREPTQQYVKARRDSGYPLLELWKQDPALRACCAEGKVSCLLRLRAAR